MQVPRVLLWLDLRYAIAQMSAIGHLMTTAALLKDRVGAVEVVHFSTFHIIPQPAVPLNRFSIMLPTAYTTPLAQLAAHSAMTSQQLAACGILRVTATHSSEASITIFGR